MKSTKLFIAPALIALMAVTSCNKATEIKLTPADNWNFIAKGFSLKKDTKYTLTVDFKELTSVKEGSVKLDEWGRQFIIGGFDGGEIITDKVVKENSISFYASKKLTEVFSFDDLDKDKYMYISEEIAKEPKLIPGLYYIYPGTFSDANSKLRVEFTSKIDVTVDISVTQIT